MKYDIKKTTHKENCNHKQCLIFSIATLCLIPVLFKFQDDPKDILYGLVIPVLIGIVMFIALGIEEKIDKKGLQNKLDINTVFTRR